MRNSVDLLKVIQKTSKHVAEAADPVAICFGIVTGVKPLKIEVEQRLPLEEEDLILTRAVRDHEVEMTVDHVTEQTSGGSGEAAFAAHTHQYKGRKKFIVHNDLIVGDKVTMLRMQGGQKYLVIDKE